MAYTSQSPREERTETPARVETGTRGNAAPWLAPHGSTLHIQSRMPRGGMPNTSHQLRKCPKDKATGQLDG